MTEGRFVARYRVAVLAVGAAWRFFALWPAFARYPLEALIYGLGLGLLPYVVLAALARVIGVRSVLIAAAIAALGLDVAAFIAARASESSTAGVAVTLRPLVSLATVAPMAILLGKIFRRRAQKPL